MKIELEIEMDVKKYYVQKAKEAGLPEDVFLETEIMGFLKNRREAVFSISAMHRRKTDKH